MTAAGTSPTADVVADVSVDVAADVVAQVSELFERYEEALVGDDVEAMSGFFWESPRVRRFGVCDEQWGTAELRRWREGQPPHPAGRRLEATDVLAVTEDVAVVTTRFGYGGPATGRQTQVWARGPAGWRIVSAHVSRTG
jgi:hypothetical protein